MQKNTAKKNMQKTWKNWLLRPLRESHLVQLLDCACTRKPDCEGRRLRRLRCPRPAPLPPRQLPPHQPTFQQPRPRWAPERAAPSDQAQPPPQWAGPVSLLDKAGQRAQEVERGLAEGAAALRTQLRPGAAESGRPAWASKFARSPPKTCSRCRKICEFQLAELVTAEVTGL